MLFALLQLNNFQTTFEKRARQRELGLVKGKFVQKIKFSFSQLLFAACEFDSGGGNRVTITLLIKAQAIQVVVVAGSGRAVCRMIGIFQPELAGRHTGERRGIAAQKLDGICIVILRCASIS